MKRLSGVVVPMVTPLTEDDRIDVESVRRLTDWCIEGGLNCLYPCGTTGEMMYLTVRERMEIAETVVEQAAGRVPVFIHAGAWNLKDTLQLARHAFEIGADGIGVVTPVFFKISDQGLVDYYVEIAKNLPDDFPVYLYAIKQNAVNDITPAVCERIVEKCLNVVGIKYSYPDLARMQDLMLVKSGTFDVLPGPDNLFASVCAAGGRGVVSGNANIVREYYAAIWDAVCHNDYEQAMKYQRAVNRLNAIMCKTNNIAAYKVLLKEEGIINTSKVRKPMDHLAPEQEEELIRTMKKMDYHCIHAE